MSLRWRTHLLCGIQGPQLLTPRPRHLVQTTGKQVQGMSHYQFDHILGTLPTEFCTNISDSLRNINESANDAYEQLKALLVTRYTKAPWTRAFELLKYPKLGDMKPPNLM
jgi:hypothetical protein